MTTINVLTPLMPGGNKTFTKLKPTNLQLKDV